MQNNVVVSLHDNTGEPFVSGGDNRVVAFDQLRVVALASDPIPSDGGADAADGGPDDPSPDLGPAPDDDGGGCGCQSAPPSAALPWLLM
ncbi:MAG: hypothetical protein GWN07_21625, partial [Actinobacteria bacterium]|nr:hypothetical protein [Actinomycetota bacterium]NIS33073.1 hypothetical protein [Actinomycetota bacterium]NIW29789.1 hypothetical protein [Actinomycetota bacterium]NIX22288.1 hypothetical protein [Actinomycetota bacterium]